MRVLGWRVAGGIGPYLLVALAATVLALASCGRGDRSSPQLGERVIPLGQPVPKGGGSYKVGNPYVINGQRYYPREDPSYDKVGTASWYGELFHGRHTANGEIYDMTALTAAHPTLPMPTYARVTNLENGRSLVVRVNDRGPFARDRVIDMSQRSAELLGFKRQGTARVRVTYLGRAPMNGDDSYERRVLAGQPWARYAGIAKSDAPLMAAAADPMVTGSLPTPQGDAGAAGRQAAAESGPLYVQAGAFRDRSNAERLSAALTDAAPVDMRAAVVGSETFYRVRLGPFTAREAAEAARARAAAAGAADARITAR